MLKKIRRWLWPNILGMAAYLTNIAIKMSGTPVPNRYYFHYVSRTVAKKTKIDRCFGDVIDIASWRVCLWCGSIYTRDK